MSTARSITLYIEPKTLKRLRLALKLYPQFTGQGEPTRLLTTDEFGERILNEVINEKYPLVKGLETKLAQAEKQYIEEHNNK